MDGIWRFFKETSGFSKKSKFESQVVICTLWGQKTLPYILTESFGHRIIWAQNALLALKSRLKLRKSFFSEISTKPTFFQKTFTAFNFATEHSSGWDIMNFKHVFRANKAFWAQMIRWRKSCKRVISFVSRGQKHIISTTGSDFHVLKCRVGRNSYKNGFLNFNRDFRANKAFWAKMFRWPKISVRM